MTTIRRTHLLTPFLLLLLFPQTLATDLRCFNLTTTFSSKFIPKTSPSCTPAISPLQLCLETTYTLPPFTLPSTTSTSTTNILTLAPVNPSNKSLQAFTTLTTLFPLGQDKGCGGFGGMSVGGILFDEAGGTFEEFSMVLKIGGGTGVFDGSKGVVFANGRTSSDGGEWQGGFEGEVCVPGPNFVDFPQCRYEGWTRFEFEQNLIP